MQFIFIVSSIFALLCLATLLLSWKHFTRLSQWWLAAAIISALCLAELFCIWHYANNKGLEYHTNHAVIANDTQLQSQLNDFNKTFTAIPTGILIEHVRFSRRDNEVYPGLLISGYLWQRYTLGVHDTIQRGILLPDAASQLNLKELFRKRKGNEEVISWSFSAHMFQSFNLVTFPFDHRHIKIQLQHVDFEKNVILKPDLSAYTITNSKSLPGIINSILHWHIEESFFSYKLKDFSTNFGIKSFVSDRFPQLYFYVIAQRNITDSALIYIILLIVAAIILFITLLAFLKDKTLIGFSTMGTLSVCSGLLFVLITSHMEMRSALDIDGTAYLEYIYIILYAMILLISINSIIFALSEKAKWIQHQDTLIIKITYWPILLFAVVLVSLFTLVF